MRILHFIPVYVPAWQFGGPILSVSRLCEGLVRDGLDVLVITTNAGLPGMPQHLLGVPQTVNGVKVIYYPIDTPGETIRSQALVQSLVDHMTWADLLHVSAIWQPLGIPVQKAAHASGVPVIHTLRGALGPYSWRYGWWKKLPYFYLFERPLLQRSASLHCTTPKEANEIKRLNLKPSISLLPNPYDSQTLFYEPRKGQEWRDSVGIPQELPLLLVVGRLHHKKGLDLLPSVLSQVSELPWHIAFIGKDDDGTGEALKTSFETVGLSDRCHWFDTLPADDLVGPYNAGDYLLLPSLHENFGNVVIEALACGCGVLVSDEVGVAPLIASCPGVTVSPLCAYTWIHKLRSLFMTTRPGPASANWISRHFSVDSVSKQAQLIYEKVLQHE